MNCEMFFRRSHHVVWARINVEDCIYDCNPPFLKLFQLSRCPNNLPIDTYFLNWSKVKDADEPWQRIELKKNWSYEEVNFYIQKNEGGYDVFGELPAYSDHEIVKEMSKLNQDFMTLTREVNKKNKDLERLLERLQKTQAQLILKERLAGLGQIAAGIAHEINNPLGIVICNMSYIKKSFETIWKKADALGYFKEDEDIDWIREDAEDVLEEISLANLRIKEIVESFREYSDLDRHTELYPYNINEGVHQTVNVMTQQFKDIHVELDLSAVGQLLVRGVEINQVLTHILQNAILSFEHELIEHPHIKISTFESDKVIHLDVVDNGCGMKEDTLEHAFDPFFSTRDIGEGKGLGLTVCYEVIVNEYDGQINLESQVNKGTVVHIVLPKYEEDEDANEFNKRSPIDL